MTLKEKVAEMQPDKVKGRFVAGVCGCPNFYEELYNSLEIVEIEEHLCPDAVSGCKDCWNREYKEMCRNDIERKNG